MRDLVEAYWKPIVAFMAAAAFIVWSLRDAPVTVGADASPASRMVILLHGHGASKTDLEPLAKELAQASPRLGFVLPNAPHRTGLSGRTWYPSVTEDSQEALDKRMAEIRAEARAVIADIVVELKADGVPAQEIYVAGFSAGAVAATDFVVSPEGADVGGLVALSGGGMEIDLAALSERPVLRAYVSHGKGDGVVGAAHSKLLAKALEEGEHEVTFTLFEGGHAIPPPVRAEIADFLK